MPINSRRKGAAGEIELFRLLSDELGYIVKRRLDAPREGGADSLDVPGWSIECKRYAKATRAQIDGWFEQAVRQAPEGTKPVLAYRVNNAKWRFVLFADDAFGGHYRQQLVEMSLQFWCEIVREGMK